MVITQEVYLKTFPPSPAPRFPVQQEPSSKALTAAQRPGGHKKSPFPAFYASSAINVNAARDNNPLRVSCLFSV
jgi:hypothetical protein